MANVTRSQYVTWINAVGNAAINRTTKVSGTDIARAAARGITISQANSSNPGNANTGELGNISVTGVGSPTQTNEVVDAEELRNLIISKATAWSRIRQVRYRLTGNVSPAGSRYTRYGYITSPLPASSVPTAGDILYDTLQAGDDIDETNFLTITGALEILVTNDSAIQEHSDITYCHSSCHSSCHASRGRR